jgi:hypothetical protein
MNYHFKNPFMKVAILFFAIILLSACNKNDDTPTNPVDQLPPATQIGANTFGCLLDGEVFIPRGGTNPLDCVYQFVNGGYYFALQGNKRDSENILIGIGITTRNLELNQIDSYILTSNEIGNASGGYFYGTLWNYTTQNHIGELTISKLDTQNQIVSGTFWFNVEDQNGVVHEIREGRFDMQFTQ